MAELNVVLYMNNINTPMIKQNGLKHHEHNIKDIHAECDFFIIIIIMHHIYDIQTGFRGPLGLLSLKLYLSIPINRLVSLVCATARSSSIDHLAVDFSFFCVVV